MRDSMETLSEWVIVRERGKEVNVKGESWEAGKEGAGGREAGRTNRAE